MTDLHSPDVDQLAATVARLTEALAASERRRAASARRQRWGAIALVVALCAAAYAQPEFVPGVAKPWETDSLPKPLMPGYFVMPETYMADSDPSLHPKDKFEGIGSLLAKLKDMTGLDGAMIKVLQSAAVIANNESGNDPEFKKCVNARKNNNNLSELCYVRTQVQDLGEYFLDDQGNPIDPSTQQGQERLMAATIMAIGQVLVDGGTMLHRLRRDSDRLRGVVASKGLIQTMNEVHADLVALNQTLSVVPAMANEMHVMNGSMATMSYSMGSTMGKMGNIVPWW